MTMKFKMGPNGFLFPADPSAKAGPRKGTPVSVIEILEVPEGSKFQDISKRLDLTMIPPGVFRIEFQQLGKDLREKSSWPDLRKAPKALRDTWRKA